MGSIGERSLERIGQVCPDARHRDIAGDIGMTPDAFSRALNDKRQFSSIELARLAELLGADLHWLITGRPDPNRLNVAARHDFDHATGRRDVPGREGDEQTLNDIGLAYRQAYPDPQPLPALPGSAAAVYTELGPNFVRPFAERLEQALGIDVVRVAELSTAYSFTAGGRRVVVVPATGNWFRENWDMGHELGHLVLGHHDDGLDAHASGQHEAAANAFAADLLLPTEVVTRVDWDGIDDSQLAELVWTWGVSVDALSRRLSHEIGHVPGNVAVWAGHPTQRLLRRCLVHDSDIDEITLRMDSAAQRRFPLALQEAHLKAVASGTLGKGTLAWMLGIDADALEVNVPDLPEVEVDDLAKALGL